MRKEDYELLTGNHTTEDIMRRVDEYIAAYNEKRKEFDGDSSNRALANELIELAVDGGEFILNTSIFSSLPYYIQDAYWKCYCLLDVMENAYKRTLEDVLKLPVKEKLKHVEDLLIRLNSGETSRCIRSYNPYQDDDYFQNRIVYYPLDNNIPTIYRYMAQMAIDKKSEKVEKFIQRMPLEIIQSITHAK